MSEGALEQKHSVDNIPDAVLLARFMRNIVRTAGARRKEPRWVIVSDLTALGSTYAAQLCRRFGLNPDEMVSRK